MKPQQHGTCFWPVFSPNPTATIRAALCRPMNKAVGKFILVNLTCEFDAHEGELAATTTHGFHHLSHTPSPGACASNVRAFVLIFIFHSPDTSLMKRRPPVRINRECVLWKLVRPWFVHSLLAYELAGVWLMSGWKRVGEVGENGHFWCLKYALHIYTRWYLIW